MHFNVRKILFHSTHFRPTFLCTHLEFFIRSKIFYPLLILTTHIVRSLSLSLSNSTSLFLALFFFFSCRNLAERVSQILWNWNERDTKVYYRGAYTRLAIFSSVSSGGFHLSFRSTRGTVGLQTELNGSRLSFGIAKFVGYTSWMLRKFQR